MDSNVSKFLGGTIQTRANNFRIRTRSSQHSATAVNSGTQKSNILKEKVIDWKAGFNLVQVSWRREQWPNSLHFSVSKWTRIVVVLQATQIGFELVPIGKYWILLVFFLCWQFIISIPRRICKVVLQRISYQVLKLF